MISGHIAHFLHNRGNLLISTANKSELEANLAALVEPIINGHGAELVDVEVKGARGNELIRLLIYKELGVSLALCEMVSREVADLFDVEDPISGRYRLEVTSPGLDRSLISDRDFARVIGQLLKVLLKSGKVVEGRLICCDNEQLLLETPAENVSVARIEIAKANIEPEF